MHCCDISYKKRIIIVYISIEKINFVPKIVYFTQCKVILPTHYKNKCN